MCEFILLIKGIIKELFSDQTADYLIKNILDINAKKGLLEPENTKTYMRY